MLLLATPAHQLGEKEWKKLVSALFTGAKLSDGNGGLLIQGELLEILANHTNDWQIIKSYPPKYFLKADSFIMQSVLMAVSNHVI